MDAREQRGLVIAAVCKVTRKRTFWEVPSQSHPNVTYVVSLKHESCTCMDHLEGGHVCKHLHAVKFVMKRECAADGTITETESLTVTKKKTYKQNWKQYNIAQSEEKRRFRVLLHDLCQGVPEIPRRGPVGRFPVPIADRLFACCYKVYSTVSTRRFNCDLQDAHQDGFLSRSLHYNKVCTFLEDSDLTGPLHALIARSSWPLKSLETQFAVDSSGFSTGRHVRWFDEKYGTERSGRDWVKVHIACGVRTHIVTAVAIYGRSAGDCPIMRELVKGTGMNFEPKEWSADSAYLSVENVESVFAQGAAPYIAFKENSTGEAGGMFQKLFHLYQFNKQDYMDHYHRRSNVESVFSAVKRLFGDYIRSRTDVAMKNEALCKLLAYNITSVIHSQCELGIEPVFWPKLEGEERNLLPLVRPN